MKVPGVIAVSLTPVSLLTPSTMLWLNAKSFSALGATIATLIPSLLSVELALLLSSSSPHAEIVNANKQITGKSIIFCNFI